MPIITPVSIGTAVHTAIDGATTLTITTTGTISQGSFVVIAVVSSAAGANPVMSISDGTNSYTKAIMATESVDTLEIWYKANASAVSSGASIVIFFTNPFNVGLGLAACAATVQNVSRTSPLDKTASNLPAVATPPPSVGTPSLLHNPELAIGATYSYGATSLPYTQSPGFANINSIDGGGTTIKLGMDFYITQPGDISANYAPVWTTPQDVGLVIATFIGQKVYQPSPICAAVQYIREMIGY